MQTLTDTSHTLVLRLPGYPTTAPTFVLYSPWSPTTASTFSHGADLGNSTYITLKFTAPVERGSLIASHRSLKFLFELNNQPTVTIVEKGIISNRNILVREGNGAVSIITTINKVIITVCLYK